MFDISFQKAQRSAATWLCVAPHLLLHTESSGGCSQLILTCHIIKIEIQVSDLEKRSSCAKGTQRCCQRPDLYTV